MVAQEKSNIEPGDYNVGFGDVVEVAQINTLADVTHGVSEISKLVRQKGYLTCVECGDKIPDARRAAYPAARTCTPCQEWVEKLKGRR